MSEKFLLLAQDPGRHYEVERELLDEPEDRRRISIRRSPYDMGWHKPGELLVEATQFNGGYEIVLGTKRLRLQVSEICELAFLIDELKQFDAEMFERYQKVPLK